MIPAELPLNLSSVILCLPAQWTAWGPDIVSVNTDSDEYRFPVGFAGEYILGVTS